MADHGMTYAWIGAKGVSADNFKWIVSTAQLPNNSSLWKSGYPDVNGNCVYSYGYSNGDLSNGGCGSNDQFICEKY